MKINRKAAVRTALGTLLIALGLLLAPQPADAGILVCMGPSVAQQQCKAWQRANDTELVVINGALGGRDYYYLRHGGADEIWGRIEYLLNRKGYRMDDVDYVYNYNLMSYSNTPDGLLDGDIERETQYWIDSMLWLQDELRKRMKNLKAGYHGVRSTSPWCEKAPMTIGIMSAYAIQQATQDNPLWHTGPDLSVVPLIRSDFNTPDSCHYTDQGLTKLTPVLNEFFLQVNPGQPEYNYSNKQILQLVLQTARRNYENLNTFTRDRQAN